MGRIDRFERVYRSADRCARFLTAAESFERGYVPVYGMLGSVVVPALALLFVTHGSAGRAAVLPVWFLVVLLSSLGLFVLSVASVFAGSLAGVFWMCLLPLLCRRVPRDLAGLSLASVVTVSVRLRYRSRMFAPRNSVRDPRDEVASRLGSALGGVPGGSELMELFSSLGAGVALSASKDVLAADVASGLSRFDGSRVRLLARIFREDSARDAGPGAGRVHFGQGQARLVSGLGSLTDQQLSFFFSVAEAGWSGSPEDLMSVALEVST